jgi:hypothetical protein
MLDQAKAWVRAQYWSRRDHRAASAGTADAGLPVVLNSAGKLGATLLANLAGILTGGGTIATGGFTFTIPATGTAALLAISNVFTAAQGFAPALTNALGISVVMPALTTVNAIKIELVNSARIAMTATAGATQVELLAADYGATIGPAVVIERNTNAATAAGCLRMMNKSGTEYYIWVDATGDLRIGTTAPTSANDLSGAVVGTQS